MSEKWTMAKALLHHPKQSYKIILQHMFLLTDTWMFRLLILFEKIPGHHFRPWVQTMSFQKQT